MQAKFVVYFGQDVPINFFPFWPKNHLLPSYGSCYAYVPFVAMNNFPDDFQVITKKAVNL